MKSGNLNFLEPSGPLHACNGTDLPFIGLYLTGKTFSVALRFDFTQIIVFPLIVTMANIRSEMRSIMQNNNVISIPYNIPHLGRKMHNPSTIKLTDTKHSQR